MSFDEYTTRYILLKNQGLWQGLIELCEIAVLQDYNDYQKALILIRIASYKLLENRLADVFEIIDSAFIILNNIPLSECSQSINDLFGRILYLSAMQYKIHNDIDNAILFTNHGLEQLNEFSQSVQIHILFCAGLVAQDLLHNHANAIEYYVESLQISSTHKASLLKYTECLLHINDLENAQINIQQMQSIIHKMYIGEYVNFLYLRAIFHEKSFDITESQNDFIEALQIAQNNNLNHEVNMIQNYLERQSVQQVL